jgi:hypothetical protein
MSEGQTTAQDRYLAMAKFPAGHQILDSQDRYRAVEIVHTRAVAEYLARELNAGRAVVDSHAIVGCKVVAS